MANEFKLAEYKKIKTGKLCTGCDLLDEDFNCLVSKQHEFNCVNPNSIFKLKTTKP